MPIEPLSITAAVIGVVRLTYDSCKSLNEKLKGIKHAPEKLETLRRDLDAFQAILNSQAEASFSGLEDVALSSDQQASLKALLTVMEGCRTICADFEKKLSHLTSHSDENRMALRDRIRLHFNDSEIGLLKENLAQSQRTLNDALGFANLCVSSSTSAEAPLIMAVPHPAGARHAKANRSSTSSHPRTRNRPVILAGEYRA